MVLEDREEFEGVQVVSGSNCFHYAFILWITPFVQPA